MEQALTDSQVKKQTLCQVLKEIESKLESLMQDKEMYRDIEDFELKKKAYQKLLYLNKIKG